MTDNTELRALLDREAIRELIDRHTDAANRADFDTIKMTYVPDGVWDSPGVGLHFDTAQAFVDFLVESGAGFEVMIQTASNPVVDLLDVDTARASTTIHEMVRVPGEHGFSLDQFGMYFDDLTRTGEGWRFTRRVFTPVLMNDTLPGSVLHPRPVSRPA
jgi:hypothetical protein